ncbi:MAG TPA: rhodanese-like domain-containing protein [bacterium]|nr:rhodanese-like domain-containing protein [bacterium]
MISKTIILAIIFGSLAGALTTYIVLNSKSSNDIIKDFYLTENVVRVSPHHIRKAMDKGDDNFILVDLRSQEEYENEHIVGAISIPAYKDPNTSAYSDVERIVKAFSELPKDKEIIVYCYSGPCMTGRKIGKMLSENDIYVKHLGIGWNEWRYFWNLWNHDAEIQTIVDDYVVSGKEPGVPTVKENSDACPIEGGFGC